jgi:hypothetical protein
MWKPVETCIFFSGRKFVWNLKQLSNLNKLNPHTNAFDDKIQVSLRIFCVSNGIPF